MSTFTQRYSSTMFNKDLDKKHEIKFFNDQGSTI